MPTKKPAKLTKSKAELQQAVDKMYKTLAAFVLAKYDFALLIYKAGNQDAKSFGTALTKTVSELGKRAGDIKFSDKDATALFQEIKDILNNKLTT